MPLFEGIDETPSRAFDLMTAVMGELVGAYEELNSTPPDRRYVWIGTPAVDCEQLVISYNRIYTGIPAQEANEPLYVPVVQRVIEMRIEVHRCVPVIDEGGDPPDPVAMQAAAQTIVEDVWIVRRALELYPSGDSLKTVGQEEQIEAQGGFAGFSILFGLGLQ
jgi:hypothetical protein